MIRTRIRQEAGRQGMTLGLLIRRSDGSISAVRRQWYNTVDGRSTGPSLESIHIATLEACARALGVNPIDLLKYVPDK